MTARIGFLGYPIQLQLQEIKDSFEHEKRKNHRFIATIRMAWLQNMIKARFYQAEQSFRSNSIVISGASSVGSVSQQNEGWPQMNQWGL